MLHSLAIANYRSLREVIVPLGPITVVTGPNGSGKSNLYRALRILQETAQGKAIASLAREGGLTSVLWAGPEQIGRAVKRGDQPVQGTVRRKPVNLRVGFAADDLSYAVDFGLPGPGDTAFERDPIIKREVLWHGEQWREAAGVADRRQGLLRARDDTGRWQTLGERVETYESMLTEIADPHRAPGILLMRDRLRSWRFYDGFRSDSDAPARQYQVGTLTPVLSNDGSDVAAALKTIRQIGDSRAIDRAVEDAFPGASLSINEVNGRLGIEFHQHGLLRPLSQAELSDGTLRYLLWIAALMTPRPPELMVLNEPETSLHPDLLPALGRLICAASAHTQVWVVTHSATIREALEADEGCRSLVLDKKLSETEVQDLSLLDRPPWKWPPR